LVIAPDDNTSHFLDQVSPPGAQDLVPHSWNRYRRITLGANGAMIATLYALEQGWGFRYENSQSIKHDRIDWMKPEHHVELLEDLRQRTGLPVERFTFGRVNLVDDTAEIKA
jgi:hypothetical protein